MRIPISNTVFITPVDLLRPWEWNALLHDKFILADDRMLLLGGRNIGDEYFAPPGYEGLSHMTGMFLF